LQIIQGLIEALQSSGKVIPLFIIDPRQIYNNEYKSELSILFMYGALKDLAYNISKIGSKLAVIKGIAEQEIPRLAALNQVDAVYLNEDYTPFSIARDLNLEKNWMKKA
jgi:deoxyribodipyrimidine photo-lyase